MCQDGVIETDYEEDYKDMLALEGGSDEDENITEPPATGWALVTMRSLNMQVKDEGCEEQRQNIFHT